MKNTAEALVDGVNSFHRRERPSPADSAEVEKLLKNLQEKGWISVRCGSDKKGKYVIRDKVHGGPIMLDPGLSEIYFNYLDFARACRDAYQEAMSRCGGCGGRPPSILQIVE